MAGIINRLRLILQTCEQTFQTILGHGFPPPGSLYAIDCNNFLNNTTIPANRPDGRSLKEILEDAIIWAVPKSRRSLERRHKRRFGIKEYIWKPHVAKTNILICQNCGYNYQAGHLCGHCYEKIKIETKEMQDVIQKELGLDPVEQDVIVLYQEEKDDKAEEFWKKQRIIEMPKKRPAWFHNNLLQPTTQEPSDKKDVKPTHLA